MPIVVPVGGPDPEQQGPNADSRYADVAAMVVRFGNDEMVRISNHTDRSATAIADEVVWRAIDDASAEADGYLHRYKLPLATVPRVLLNVVCDIARYRLYDNRATDQVTRRYEDAVKLLKSISTGVVGLGLDAAQAPVTTDSAAGPMVTGGGRVFSAELLGDY
jgi:phage gp36-like protein